MKTSTALILAGAAIAVVYFATRSSPKLPARSGSSSSSSSAALGGLGSFFGGLIANGGGALSNLFGGGGGDSSSSSGPSVPSYFDTDNYTVTSGFEFTDASGNFIAG